MTDLKFHYYVAQDNGVKEHAQKAMKDLGITYERGEACALAEGWFFKDCKNIPDPLPPYLEVNTTWFKEE